MGHLVCGGFRTEVDLHLDAIDTPNINRIERG